MEFIITLIHDFRCVRKRVLLKKIININYINLINSNLLLAFFFVIRFLILPPYYLVTFISINIVISTYLFIATRLTLMKGNVIT